jgi:hypothetical protein
MRMKRQSDLWRGVELHKKETEKQGTKEGTS